MRNCIVIFLILILVLQFSALKSQEYYWVAFTDKKNTPYSLSSPEEYLSERAIQRRGKQNIAIDSLDLPVSTEYVSQVVRPGVSLVHSSKWLNGITVKVEIDSFENKISPLAFVKEIQLTKPGKITKSGFDKFYESSDEDPAPIDTSVYGYSANQVGQLNGQFLHNQGFRGEGKHIAVLDGGFFNADSLDAFDSLWVNSQILGTKDFVNAEERFFKTDYHGMSVLSCMGGNVPGDLIGTAPKASYWLIRSEDTGSEYIIEEDNWVAAAEFADSAGADVINSSLGYFTFSDTTANHSYFDMDGNTTRVTRGANIAASRGMLVFSSAGNERNDEWKYIIAPSDGDNVIGVGAVNKDGIAASFTSYGPASDGDIKPNVAGFGVNTFLQKSNGLLGYNSGTSFSSPVVAGMGACLWQANPHATAAQVKSAIEQSGHLFESPDSLLGYGIPDMYKANLILMSLSAERINIQKQWTVYPNPVEDVLVLQKNGAQNTEQVKLSFFSMDGRLLMNETRYETSKIVVRGLQFLPAGLFILKIETGNASESVKLSKSR